MECKTEEKRGRGRPRKLVVGFPKGEFTIKDVATFNKISTVSAQLYTNEGLKTGTIRFLRNQESGSRGRQSRLFAKQEVLSK